MELSFLSQRRALHTIQIKCQINSKHFYEQIFTSFLCVFYIFYLRSFHWVKYYCSRSKLCIKSLIQLLSEDMIDHVTQLQSDVIDHVTQWSQKSLVIEKLLWSWVTWSISVWVGKEQGKVSKKATKATSQAGAGKAQSCQVLWPHLGARRGGGSKGVLLSYFVSIISLFSFQYGAPIFYHSLLWHPTL